MCDSLGSRFILHIDLDAFFASVEAVENPDLQGQPIIVGGLPDQRGVVAAANYLARQFGVHSAMSTALAVRRCPKAIVLPPRRDVYQLYTNRVMDILSQTSPLVEQLSMDEAFLDMSDQVAGHDLASADDLLDLARKLQTRIQTEVHLSASIGIASNKLTAKIASDFQKPSGLTLVPAGTEREFLSPLVVSKLWGVGPKMAAKLNDMGVRTIGHLAQLSEQALVREFGINGTLIWQHAQGVDNHPVVAERETKSFSQETTFAKDVSSPQILGQALQSMSQTLAQRLQDHNFTARTVSLKLRYGDFNTLTRSHTQDPAIKTFTDIHRRVLYLWQKHWNPARPVRLIGVGVTNLLEGVAQLSLFGRGF